MDYLIITLPSFCRKKKSVKSPPNLSFRIFVNFLPHSILDFSPLNSVIVKLNLLVLLLVLSLFSTACQTKKAIIDNQSEKVERSTAKSGGQNPNIEINGERPNTEAAEIEATKPITGVRFVESEMLKPLLEQAKTENKLVFVDFYTDWCAPCKLMDKKVFPDEAFGAFMNENFISYKINMEDGPGSHLVALYEVRSVPTLLFLDQEGEILERKAGAAFQTELKQMAEKALATLKTD